MNNEENQNTRSDQEAREERVLALLLDELNAEEAKSVEALLAEDVDLQAYRDRLERTLDLVAESARAKADIDLENFKLDPERRQVLERLWNAEKPQNETVDAGKTVPFEPTGRTRGKLSRFLPMAAAAVVAVGATGVIVSSLNEQAKHEEHMALATEDAIGTKETEKPVLLEQSEKVREAGIGEEDAPTSIDGANLALADASEVLALTVIEESEKILNDRLASEVVAINDELLVRDDDDIGVAFDLHDVRAGVDEGASRSGRGQPIQTARGVSYNSIGLDRRVSDEDLLDLDDSESVRRSRIALSQNDEFEVDSLSVLDRKLGEEKKTVGTVRSFLEADAIGKRTAFASGGASAAGAGLLIANDETVASKAVPKSRVMPRARVAAPFGQSESEPLRSNANGKIEKLEVAADRLLLPVEKIAVTEDAPSVLGHGEFQTDKARYAANRSSRENADSDSLHALRKETSQNQNETKGKVVEVAPISVDAPAGISSTSGEAVLAEINHSFKKAQKIKRDEEGLPNFSSLHEAGAAPGAIAGEKGADKELLAFADFGLGGTQTKDSGDQVTPSQNKPKPLANSGKEIDEARVVVIASASPGVDPPPVSEAPAGLPDKDSLQDADTEAAPDSTLASGPDRWMIWTGLVLLGLLALAAFRSRGKA